MIRDQIISILKAKYISFNIVDSNSAELVIDLLLSDLTTSIYVEYNKNENEIYAIRYSIFLDPSYIDDLYNDQWDVYSDKPLNIDNDIDNIVARTKEISVFIASTKRQLKEIITKCEEYGIILEELMEDID